VASPTEHTVAHQQAGQQADWLTCGWLGDWPSRGPLWLGQAGWPAGSLHCHCLGDRLAETGWLTGGAGAGGRQLLLKAAERLLRHIGEVLGIPEVLRSPVGDEYLSTLRNKLLTVPQYCEVSSPEVFQGARRAPSHACSVLQAAYAAMWHAVVCGVCQRGCAGRYVGAVYGRRMWLCSVQGRSMQHAGTGRC
jgi:hypothetical protein